MSSPFEQAFKRNNGEEPPAAEARVFLRWSELATRKAPPRKWILPDWIPAHCVTLLHGYGGVGKSLLAQQIGTAAAFEHELLGGTAHACPVLGWFGEDDHDELWRRQEAINVALGINMVDLEGKLFWRPCPGDDITLFKASNESDFAPTPMLKELREQIGDLKAKLVILDSATQIAALPEISRPLVTRCLQMLNRLCLEFSTTIQLLGHNNRQGDYSGSSAWENRVRSRMHLKRESIDGGERTIIARPKANYAALEEGIELRWCEGAFQCVDQRCEDYGAQLDRQMREGAAEQAFLNALDQLTKQQRPMSASPKAGGSYAPTMIIKARLNAGPAPRGNLDEVNGNSAPFSKRELEEAMERLFKAGKIRADQQLWKKPDRHWAVGIARTAPPERAPETGADS
jgi:RecA-family ATPase